MKITKFKVSVPLDIERDYFVHIEFLYGDGNYGDYELPHSDELIEITDWEFEPTGIDEMREYSALDLEALVMDFEHEWINLED